jgi:hypothetical protein
MGYSRIGQTRKSISRGKDLTAKHAKSAKKMELEKFTQRPTAYLKKAFGMQFWFPYKYQCKLLKEGIRRIVNG